MSRSAVVSSIFCSLPELAQRLGVPPSTLRRWEEQFSDFSPIMRQGGRRYYRECDIAVARVIHQLTVTHKLTVPQVQWILERYRSSRRGRPPRDGRIEITSDSIPLAWIQEAQSLQGTGNASVDGQDKKSVSKKNVSSDRPIPDPSNTRRWQHVRDELKDIQKTIHDHQVRRHSEECP